MQESYLSPRWESMIDEAVKGGFNSPYSDNPYFISLMDMQSVFCEFRKYLNLQKADDPNNNYRCKRRYFK